MRARRTRKEPLRSILILFTKLVCVCYLSPKPPFCKGGLKYPQHKVVNDCAIFETNKKPDAQHTWRITTIKCEEKLDKK